MLSFLAAATRIAAFSLFLISVWYLSRTSDPSVAAALAVAGAWGAHHATSTRGRT